MALRQTQRILRSYVKTGAILLAVLVPSSAEQEKIGKIEFFGSKGIDLRPVLQALPIHEGGPLPKSKKQIREAIQRTTAISPTDVAVVCCDESREWMIYVGLPGESSRVVAYNSPPKGRVRLPGEATKLYKQTMDAMMRAVMKGDTEEETDSPGFALAKNALLRAKQLEIRKYAVAHGPLLIDVLESSSDAFHREVAAHFLGYAQQSPMQINSLVHASSDPNDNVRNNAVRALGELAGSSQTAAEQIDPAPFLEMLSSGIWSDRNKAVFVMDGLTLRRPPDLMARLRGTPLEALLEIGRWRWRGHSTEALRILGRIAGMEERDLQSRIEERDSDSILSFFLVSDR